MKKFLKNLFSKWMDLCENTSAVLWQPITIKRMMVKIVDISKEMFF